MTETICAKIERAKQHIADLDAALYTFHHGTRHPCKVDEKGYMTSTKGVKCMVYEVVYMADVPDSIPLLIGDALQNLRTSLDYLACQLVLAAGGTPTKRTAFPISKSAEDYLSEAPGKVAGMRQEVINKIAALKPYKGGNEPLWRLHTLNNRDKHNLPIACMPSAGERIGLGQDDGIPVFTTEFFNVPLKKGAKFALPVPKDEDKTQIRCHIAFNEPGTVDGESVTGVLNDIADVVTNVSSSFEPFLV